MNHYLYRIPGRSLTILTSRYIILTLLLCSVSLMSVTEGRGRKKQKKELGQLLATAAITAGAILGPIFLKSIALIAGKALIISKIAIVIAGTVALKKLLSQPQHHETETVSHHYGRSLDIVNAQDQAYQGYSPQPFTHTYDIQTPGPTSSPQPMVSQEPDDFRGRKKVYYEYEEEHTPTRIIIENGRRPVTMIEEEDNEKYQKYSHKDHKDKHPKRKPGAFVDDFEPMREPTYSQMEYYEDERPVRKRPGVLDLMNDDDDDEYELHAKKKQNNKNDNQNKKDNKKQTTPKPNGNKNKQDEKKKEKEKSTTPAWKKNEKKDQTKIENKILLVTLTNKNSNNSTKLEERIDNKDLNKESKQVKGAPKIPYAHYYNKPSHLAHKDKDVLLKIGKLKIGLIGGTIAMLFITLVDFILFTMYRSKDKDMQKILDSLPPQYVHDMMKPAQKPDQSFPDFPSYPSDGDHLPFTNPHDSPMNQMPFNPHDPSANQIIPYAPISNSQYNNIKAQLDNDMQNYLKNIQSQTGSHLNISDLQIPDDLLSLDTPPPALGLFNNDNSNQPSAPASGDSYSNYKPSNQNSLPPSGVDSYSNYKPPSAPNLPPTANSYSNFNSGNQPSLPPTADSYNNFNAGLYTTAIQQSFGTNAQSSSTGLPGSNLDADDLIKLLNPPPQNESGKKKEEIPQKDHPYYQLPLENEVKNLDNTPKDTWQTDASQYSPQIQTNPNSNPKYNVKIISQPQAQPTPVSSPQFTVGNLNLQNNAANLKLQNSLGSNKYPAQQGSFGNNAVSSSTQAPIYKNNYKVASLSVNPYSTPNKVSSSYLQTNNQLKDNYLRDPYKQLSSVLSNQFGYMPNNPVKQFAQNPLYAQQVAPSLVNTADSELSSSNVYAQVTNRPTKLQTKYKRIIKRKRIPAKATKRTSLTQVPRYRVRSTTSSYGSDAVPVSPTGRFRRSADFDSVESFIRIRNTLVEQDNPSLIVNNGSGNIDESKTEEDNSNSTEYKADENTSSEVVDGNTSDNKNASEYDEESSAEEVTQKLMASVTEKTNDVQSDSETVSKNTEKKNKYETDNLNEVIINDESSENNENSQVIPDQIATATEDDEVITPVKFSLVNLSPASPPELETVTTNSHESNPVSTEKFYSPVSTAKYYAPVSTQGYYNPVSTEKYYDAVSTEKQYTIIATEKYVPTDSTRKQYTPISTETYFSTESTRKYYNPIATEKYYATMTTEKYHVPISTSKYQDAIESLYVPIQSPKPVRDAVEETSTKGHYEKLNTVEPGFGSTSKPLKVTRKPQEKKEITKRKATTERTETSTTKRPKQNNKKKNKIQPETTTESNKKTKSKTKKGSSSKNTNKEVSESNKVSGSKTKTTVKEDSETYKHVEEIKEDGSKVIKIIIEPPAYLKDKKDDDDGEYGLYDDDGKPEPPGNDDYFSFNFGAPKDATKDAKKVDKDKSEEEEEQDDKDSEEDEQESEEDEKDSEEEEEEKDANTENKDAEDDEDDDELGDALSLFYNAVLLDGASVIDTGLLR
uniref:Uncharacterized protein n=1 Tax=Cacopsylla melanoneura TaxID=428564 RepID=A0A8D9F6K5_9HEMI